MRSPALWLYLLGAVTFLTIALRRVLQRVNPLNDEVYAKQVAIDHVHSGVAWVRFDGTIGSVNPAVTKTLNAAPRGLVGSSWTSMFPPKDRARLEEAFSQALLMGKAPLEVDAQRVDGSLARVNVLLVSIHDHKSRFIGHYCLMEDRTYVFELEGLLQRLSAEQVTEA
jgi:PAS domain S-box-containing protein